MRVPFLDIGAQHKGLKKEISSAINRVIERGDFILGKEVSIFEKEFAKVCKVKYALGVSSGTAALFLALKARGLKEGEEVIVPAFTYIATAFAVSYCGVKPVFVDIDEKTYNIDAGKIKSAITDKTRAIIPVHLYGQPADMAEIWKISREYNLVVIEDAAQAHGASIKMADGKWLPVGSIGDVACFSFYPTKNLGGMGDGGMITTNSDKIYKKLLMLRDYGRISRYEHAVIGYNSRLDTLQAAVLSVKLRHLQGWNKMRQEAAAIYDRLLENSKVTIPFVGSCVKHVYHAYAVRSKKRDDLMQKFKERGIGSIIYYPLPLHLQKAYEELGYKQGDFPVAERIAKEIISLPIFPHIKNKQIKFVADTIKEVNGD